MIWTYPDPVLFELITRVLPSLSRMPRIGPALTKYTSGYLTGKRLAKVMSGGTLPAAIVTLIPRAGDRTDKVHDQQGLGHHVRGSDVISLKDALFEEYKKRAPGLPRTCPRSRCFMSWPIGDTTWAAQGLSERSPGAQASQPRRHPVST